MQQLVGILGAEKGAEVGAWVDSDTPAGACSLPLCTSNSYDACASGASRENLVLVFSDEFESSGRGLSAQSNDKRWTADNLVGTLPPPSCAAPGQLARSAA